MEFLIAILLGVGLSAACGLRVFVPPLVASLAAISGHLTLAPGFEWIGTPTAAIALAVAAVIELVAYYVPFLDNLLDGLTAPAALVAGTLLTASFVGDMDPMLRWTLAGIAGGGAAVVVKAGVASVRAVTTVATAGLGNFVVATLELLGAMALAAMAVLAPWVALAALGAAAVWLGARLLRRSLQPELKPPLDLP